MKCKIFLLLTLNIIAVSLYSQGVIYNSILKDSLYYDYDEYNELFFNTDFNCFYLEETKEPALPYCNIYIDIPYGYEFLDYEYNIEKGVVLSGIHVSPNIQYYCSDDSVLEQEHNLDYNNNVYPSNVLSYVNTYIERGKKKLSFRFSPFVYNENDSLLYNINSLTITINFTGGYSIVKNYGGNSNESIEYVSQTNADGVNQIIETFNPNDSTEYLVITSSAFIGAFKPLVEWKTLKGIPAKVISLDSIYCLYEDIPNEIKIKSYIKELYDKTNKRLKYVLLGGDDTVVPVKYCRVAKINTKNDTTYQSDVPTDIFYGCFDGEFSWDANGDGISGDVNYDDIDYFPEVYVSRFPARTTSDVNAMIDKTLNYEKNPPLDDWCYDILNFGCKLSSIRDAEHKSDSINKYTFEKYLDNPDIFKLFNCNTSYPEGDDYELNPENIQKELSKGYHFVNEFSHGETTYWKIIDTNSYRYNTDYASILSSLKPMHIATIACHTNAFHLAEPCLGEAFMRNRNSNVVTYWGSSSNGWGDPRYNKLGPSETLIKNYYKLLLNNINGFKNFAELTTKAKLGLEDFNKNYSSHWVFFSVNSMGDPELPIYTRKPKEFKNISFEQNTNSLIMIFGELETNVTIYGYTKTGELFYKVYKNISDSCSVNGDLESFAVTFSKPNYVPCTLYFSVSNIQNKTFVGNNSVYVKNVNIGYNITDSLQHGNVILKNGKTIINSSGNIYIKNGFYVNPSNKLYIK
ncbi:MAG: hypothetical protein IKU50_01905 [Bacteroidaceae bacterium]|nr:hypothetical protein [Bacteroidaceae bacterium]